MIENGQEPYAPGGITLCPDGKYCWVYELKLLKNPAILCVIWKIIVGAFLGVWLFVMLLSLGDTHFWRSVCLPTCSMPLSWAENTVCCSKWMKTA